MLISWSARATAECRGSRRNNRQRFFIRERRWPMPVTRSTDLTRDLATRMASISGRCSMRSATRALRARADGWLTVTTGNTPADAVIWVDSNGGGNSICSAAHRCRSRAGRSYRFVASNSVTPPQPFPVARFGPFIADGGLYGALRRADHRLGNQSSLVVLTATP